MDYYDKASGVLRTYLLQSDVRIDTVDITKGSAPDTIILLIRYKKPFNNYRVFHTVYYEQLHSILLFKRLNPHKYDPWIIHVAEDIKKAFNEKLLEQSFEEVKKHEPKPEPKPESEPKNTTLDNIIKLMGEEANLE